ncbi:DegT/DnrJ/EryC1/StrS family aminotransferase [Magnetovibrio sp. PR-2]|uniref:DegT/DnrJ/EryC1/StrS family aminotransferase n=1 Tax=Magnetovibrio sp. PR-2 TaxID=3120356 RepID=UPI002FCE55C4
MSQDTLSAFALGGVLEGFDLQELIQPPLSNPKVRFRNLAVENDELRHKLLAAVDDVLKSGQLIMGAAVRDMEEKLAAYCQTNHCIGVSSGTSAIYVALAGKGVGPGDEVITTSLSAIGTATAIMATGAKPVFVDIGEDLNINADLIEGAITPLTKAILPVHYTGRLCDMDKIMAVAHKHDLIVVEDASQAWGAKNHLGYAGAIGDSGAISTSQMKILNSYGEAGIILTADIDYADEMVSIRYLGMVNREVCVFPTMNHKIDTLQAAMMMAGFDLVEGYIQRRLEIAMRYHDGLHDVVNCPEPPKSLEDRTCVFFDYTVYTPERSRLRLWMEEKGVEVKIRHPLSFIDQPCFQDLPKPDAPVVQRLVHEILSLPIHEKMTNDDVDYVIEAVRSYFRA